MAKRINRALAYRDWPLEAKTLFHEGHPRGDLFDLRPNADLSDRTIYMRKIVYGQFLLLLSEEQPEVLRLSPDRYTTPATLDLFIARLRRNCTETTVYSALQCVYLVSRAMLPNIDWQWIYTAQRRIQKAAKPLKHREVLSDELYLAGLTLIDQAIEASRERGTPTLPDAEMFRDGFMIALLAEKVMRRKEIASIKIDAHLKKIDDLWVITVPPEAVKTHLEPVYRLSPRLSGLMDLYLETYRPLFPNADGHQGLWPYGDRPMVDKMIRRYVRKHTEEALGYAVTPHRFRNAAATFTSVVDPKNIRMAKGLLGHTTFAMTEKHYIGGSRSRIAGRAHAKTWKDLATRIRKSAGNAAG